jgi:hypothetical protein
MLDDPYPAVRIVAARSLRSLPGFEGLRYDPTGPQEERTAAVQEAFRAWGRARRGRAPAAAEATLVDAGGLRREAFEALWMRRNDRVVELRE